MLFSLPPATLPAKGDTTSGDFPIVGPLQIMSGGDTDAFVAKVNADASALLYSTYLGEMVTADVIRRVNPGPMPVALELKIWRQDPDGTITSFDNAGADGTLQLPAQSDVDSGPLPLFEVVQETVRGRYEFSCRLLEPLTGKLIAEDRNPFDIP